MRERSRARPRVDGGRNRLHRLQLRQVAAALAVGALLGFLAGCAHGGCVPPGRPTASSPAFATLTGCASDLASALPHESLTEAMVLGPGGAISLRLL